MYLKHNVKLAPYIWNWYAWSHLISPHTAAMNITDRHIKIMESFVDYPDMHYEAIHSKKMIGGPFINLNPVMKREISKLLDKTKEQCRRLMQLSQDIKEFDLFIQNNSNGKSLEELYISLPSSLKGLVELTYDTHNHPNVRFIEPLIYKKYFSNNDHTIILSEVINDDRPFCLSTPHISSDDILELEIPFSDLRIDSLMRMKTMPGNFSELAEILNISSEKLPLFKRLFTEKSIHKDDVKFCSSGVRVRYFGHACVFIQTESVNILIDPILGYDYDGKQCDRFTYLDLPEVIDYVVITHNHQDHILLEVLLQLRHRIKNIIIPACNDGSLTDPSMKLMLKYLGFKNVITLNSFEDIDLNDETKISALPFLGEHGDLDIRSKNAYYMKVYDLSLIFLADSNNLDPNLYEHIFDYTGPVDMLFIGMECVGAPVSWLYGPMFSKNLSREHDQSRRLSGSDFKKALDIISKSNCKEVNIYAMGMEPWLSYIMAVDYTQDSIPMIESDKLVSHCKAIGLPAERLYGKKEWVFPDGKYNT